MHLSKSFILAVLLLAPRAEAVEFIHTLSGPITNPANNHQYYLLSSASWTDSQAFAQTLGGNLVTINDLAENQWVFNTFTALAGTPNPNLWIGLTDSASEGNFAWISGEPVTFTFWYFGEPNNTPNADPTGEDYVAIRAPDEAPPSGSWNDLPNNGGGFAGNIFGVVEVVPEPSVMSLLALGLCGWFIRRSQRA